MLLSKETLERGIVRLGNNYRLKKLFDRAKAGESLTIGFLGGSITQGSVASDEKLCYAYRTFEWFEKTFPKASFKYVNAGIGGTTSQFGVSRADRDLLSADPDFVVIEFSVNDSNDPLFKETYEGLVRKVFRYRSEPAVVVLHNVCYDTGVNAEEVHLPTGEYYSIPAASVKWGEYADIEKGLIKREDITPDMLHPNDLGHGMLAEQLTFLLEKELEAKDTDEEFAFPKEPLTQNRFEHADRILNDGEANLSGFEKDLSPKQASWDHFHNGWTAVKPGDKISFELDAAVIAVQYRKTPELPAIKAVCVLDGNKTAPVVLDGAFDETWGDCLFCETVLNDKKPEKHTIEITVTEAPEGFVKPFYLLSVLYA
ncbi:MAG: SGNH/GDSL hydrolase family protein [Lachnospiraceae bacterium]|nr:SGNH/GDSL hydrolase family protein [Lachnospiraceae bacterium]MBP5185040.1 SGNH/GDSL hydrolase family protein [Lachnospiraceae bacterium]